MRERMNSWSINVFCILGIPVILIVVGINTIAYADENKFCDEWGIIGLGSVYLRSMRLKITENDITWPGCKSAPYKIISMENDSAKRLVPHLDCSGIRKDSGEGYIMMLTQQYGDELEIRVYDARENDEKGKDKERIFFGQIGNYPVSMRLEVSKKGGVVGNYSYDKDKKEMPLRGKIDGSNIVLNVYDDTDSVLEIFDGKYIDGKIDGIWKHKGQELEFHLVREPWDDHYVSCEEMQKYPEKVFGVKGVDLGSGAGSPNGVDYECEGGLASLQFMKKLHDLADQIRSEGPAHICSGSSVHAHWRYFHYELLEAGLAPDIYALYREEREKNAEVYSRYENALSYFRLWAHESLYNFELYNNFWKGYNHVKPALIRHYKQKCHVSSEKATDYADNALSRFVTWAAGSYEYDLQGGKPSITPIEKAVADPNTTTKNLADIIEQKVPQDDLDQALTAALLYQRSRGILELLLKKGARINSGDESALFFALRNREHVRLLLARGADVNYENGFGKTALFYAIGFNDIGMVRLLLDHKADVNHAYKSKESIEAEFAFVPLYCLLTHYKRTPLMHAAQHGDVALIKLLLKRGAKLDAVDQKEFNAADYARMGQKPENLHYLRSLGLKENMSRES